MRTGAQIRPIRSRNVGAANRGSGASTTTCDMSGSANPGLGTGRSTAGAGSGGLGAVAVVTLGLGATALPVPAARAPVAGTTVCSSLAAAAVDHINSEALTTPQVSATTTRRARPTARIALPLDVSIRLPANAGDRAPSGNKLHPIRHRGTAPVYCSGGTPFPLHVPRIMRLPAEDPPDHRLEHLQWLGGVVRIERRLVPARAKSLAGAIPGVALQPVPRIAIATQVVSVVVGLHQPVLLDDPGHLGAHVRAQHGGRELRVVVRRQLISNIMEQRGDQQLVIRTVRERSRRGLQRMAEPADRISLE